MLVRIAMSLISKISLTIFIRNYQMLNAITLNIRCKFHEKKYIYCVTCRVYDQNLKKEKN